MDTIDTGLILKHIGNYDMGTFVGRMILQNTVYLLKSFGLDLGYGFIWYFNRTYSTDLAKVGFELESQIEKIPVSIPVKFTDEKIQSRYEMFMEFIEDKKDDLDLLDVSSYMCFLYKLKMKKDIILEFVEKKKSKFTKKQCLDMWDELEKFQVIHEPHS